MSSKIIEMKNNNGTIIDIDEIIAPLITEIWQSGLNTYYSGIFDGAIKYICIVFNTVDEGNKFFSIVLKNFNKQEDIYSRIVGNNPNDVNNWYSLIDSFTINEYSDDDDDDDDNDIFKMQMLVRFPYKDLDEVYKRIKSYNKN